MIQSTYSEVDTGRKKGIKLCAPRYNKKKDVHLEWIRSKYLAIRIAKSLRYQNKISFRCKTQTLIE